MIRTIHTLCFILMVLVGAVYKASAQRIGGVPIRDFNPTDSGAPYHGGFFMNKNSFWPGGNGHVFMSMPKDYNHSFFGLAERYQQHILADLSPSGAIDTTTKPLQRGFIRAFLKDPQGRSVMLGTSDLYGNTDTVTLTKSYLRIPGNRDLRAAWKGGKFAVHNAAFGNYKAGLVQAAGIPGQYLLWITHSSSGDTLSVVDETVLIRFDTATFTENLRTALAGILVQASSFDPVSGQPHFLATTTAGTPIHFQIDAGLQYQPNGVPTATLTGDPGLMQFRPDGKLLIAGRFGSFIGVKLFENNGQEITSFPTTELSAANGRFLFSYDNGIVRAISYDTTSAGWAASARQYVMAAAGGWASTRTTVLDSAYRAGKPLFYMPEKDAWFLETGMLPFGQANGYLLPKYRFLLSSNGVQSHFGRPQGNAGDLYLSYASVAGDADPAVDSQILLMGNSIIQNGRLTPGFAVINTDGNIDPAFTSSLKFPSDLTLSLGFGYYRTNNWSQPTRAVALVPGNRILFTTNFNLIRDDTSAIDFPDTLYRYNFNGTPAPTQRLVRAIGLFSLKSGGYATLAFVNNDGTHRGAQQFNAPPAWNQMADWIHVLRLDATGELVDTVGKIPFSTLPDSLNNLGRWIYMRGEDNEGGFWVSCNLNSSLGNDTLGQRSWLQRVKPGEPTIRFCIDSNYVVQNLIRIEVLPGKKFRLFGMISKVTQVVPRPLHYQVVLVDSVGHILPDPEFPSHRPYTLPDAYTVRGSQGYVSLDRSLPDGRFIVHCYPSYGKQTALVYLRDGRLDPSFMPISSNQPFSLSPIGNRLYARSRASVYSSSANLYQGRQPNLMGGVAKNGLYAFYLNAGSGNRGFAQGTVERVASPQAQGCNPTGPRHPVAGMVITAGNSLALTDTAGRYAIVLDSGSHTLRQDIGNDFLQRQICPAASAGHQVSIDRPGQTVLGKDYINESYDCPRLTLYFGPNRTRLCSRGTTSVFFKNEGTATAPDTRLRVFLPSLMTFRGASVPYTQETDGSFTFPIGNIAAGQTGSFVIYDSVGCVNPDTNLRVCYTARIEPMAVCGALSTAQINWDGAWLDAKANYEATNGGRARYRIVNRGRDMADSVSARLISNDYYPAFMGKIKLRAGDSLVLYARAGEAFFSQLTLNQTAECPLGTFGTIAFSGVGNTPTYLSLENGWLGRQTVSQCLPVRFAFDPNEKTVYPDKQVDPGETLHYTIHFENLGNDTALSVVVLDTLPAELDVRGFAFEGSSHLCRTTLEGTASQPVLNFNFSPISLLAKRQDSVASKGYVRFALPVKKTVPRGTWIRNRGHIYFDRNPAVITEYSKVQVRTIDAPTGTAQLFGSPALTIAPNPNGGRFKVIVPEGHYGHELVITDVTGRVVARKPLQAEAAIDVTGLAPGVYTASVKGLKATRLIIQSNGRNQ